MYNKSSDIEIIDAVLAGNQYLYSELVRRHQRFVFTLALRFSKNREDAEEISQDTFIKAYRYLNNFQRTSKFSTWLYTIVYNTSMTFLRKKNLDTLSLDQEENSTIIEHKLQGTKNNFAEKASQSFYINKAIEQLSSEDGNIITLFYNAEQSLQEIAQITGLEANTVKVKLHRARHRLKEKLEMLLKGEEKELLL